MIQILKEVNMSEIQLSINTFIKARKFYTTMRRFEGNFELKQDQYVINALSQLGIFSLDLSRPITLEYNTKTPDEELFSALEEFLIPTSDTQEA